MTRCLAAASYLDTFVDGELPPEKLAEIENHLASCSACSARVSFERALRASTRTAVRTADAPSATFRDRIAKMLEEERQRGLGAGAVGSAVDSFSVPFATDGSSGIMRWRTILTLAAAVALVLWGGWSSTVSDSALVAQSPEAARSPAHTRTSQATLVTSTATLDQLIEEFVDYHIRPRTPQVTEPSQVPSLEPEVGLPVRLLPSLQEEYGAHWQGGSVVWVQRDPSAASLQYNLDGHRITVYVYNSARYPLRARLEPRVVRNVPVFVGNRRGYSIAAMERSGVGYALATDLGDAKSAELVATTIH